MTELTKVFMGFHSDRVKALVLLGMMLCHLMSAQHGGVICKGPILQPLKIKPPLCLKNNGHQSPSDMAPYPISKRNILPEL